MCLELHYYALTTVIYTSVSIIRVYWTFVVNLSSFCEQKEKGTKISLC